jgi:hypothetical protein
MPNLPAVCDKCGAISLSDVKVKDCTCHIKDQVAGACECGGALKILDGTYSHLGGPLNYCRATKEDQAKFLEMCRHCGVELHQPQD